MTRAHVKLLGPCFKTDRMEQGTNATTDTTAGEFLRERRSRAQGRVSASSISPVVVRYTRTQGLVANHPKADERPTFPRTLGHQTTDCDGGRGESRLSQQDKSNRCDCPERQHVTQPPQPINQAQSAPEPTASSIRLPPNNFTHFELSLQSSFQLSLTVLVRYRSRRHI